ncbi:hypothetical protein AAIA72_10205 [Hahella sp. SMD15-11]|uniref:STAS/SEC14 domain-containing protein n=1 Tax=Thermohahella caldifontis TaxID=3142973 RepID=A0AB39UT25_9GAMM
MNGIEQEVHDHVIYVRFIGHVTAQHMISWLSEVAGHLSGTDSAVLVVESAEAHEIEAGARRYMVTWMKANRSLLRSGCRAVIRIVRDRQQRAKLSRPQIAKAFPVPLELVDSREAAWECARRWLSGQCT